MQVDRYCAHALSNGDDYAIIGQKLLISSELRIGHGGDGSCSHHLVCTVALGLR